MTPAATAQARYYSRKGGAGISQHMAGGSWSSRAGNPPVPSRRRPGQAVEHLFGWSSMGCEGGGLIVQAKGDLGSGRGQTASPGAGTSGCGQGCHSDAMDTVRGDGSGAEVRAQVVASRGQGAAVSATGRWAAGGWPTCLPSAAGQPHQWPCPLPPARWPHSCPACRSPARSAPPAPSGGGGRGP